MSRRNGGAGIVIKTWSPADDDDESVVDTEGLWWDSTYEDDDEEGLPSIERTPAHAHAAAQRVAGQFAGETQRVLQFFEE